MANSALKTKRWNMEEEYTFDPQDEKNYPQPGGRIYKFTDYPELATIFASAPVTKEEREKWLKKTEYGGKTRRLIDSLNQAESERDALIGKICNMEQVHGIVKSREEAFLYWSEWARKEAGKKD